MAHAGCPMGWDGMGWGELHSFAACKARIDAGACTSSPTGTLDGDRMPSSPPRRLAVYHRTGSTARQLGLQPRHTISRLCSTPTCLGDQNRVPGPARGLTGYLCNRPEGVQPASGSSHPTGSLSDPLAPVLRDQVPAMDRVTQVDAAFPLVGNNTPDSSPLRRACWSAKRHWGPICFPLPRSRPSGACLGLCARQEFPYRPSSP